MPQFVPLCQVADTPQEGEVCEVAAANRVFCVARVNGELVVMDNVCPHRGGPLGQGLVEEGRIVCPWHAWAFDAKTGCASHNQKACVRRYRVQAEGNVVQVDLD